VVVSRTPTLEEERPGASRPGPLEEIFNFELLSATLLGYVVLLSATGGAVVVAASFFFARLFAPLIAVAR